MIFDTALFTQQTEITETVDELEARLGKVIERYEDYHPDCQRRLVAEESRSVRDRIRGAWRFMAGDYDQTYCSGLGYDTVHDWRFHYAADALRTASHHLVWAEVYAGLRSRESAFDVDPFRNQPAI